MSISPKELYCPERDGLLDCDNCEWQKHCELEVIDKRIQDLEYGIEHFGFDDITLEKLKEELKLECEHYDYKQKLLEEIQNKTEVISEKTKGTQFEELGIELNQSSQSLSQIRDTIGFKKQVDVMQNTLKAICSKFPEGQKGEACESLKMMYAESSIEDKIPLMNIILSKFSYQLDMTNQLNIFEGKLDNISYGIFKIKLNNRNVISNLDAMTKELEKLNKKMSSNTSSFEELNPNKDKWLDDLNNDIQDRLNELEYLIGGLTKNNDTKNILSIMNELKQSKLGKSIQTPASIATLIGFLIQAMQAYQQYKLF